MNITKLRYLPIAIAAILACLKTDAQFINDGAQVFVQKNAFIHVQSDFVHQCGFIQNEGRIEVGEDWINDGVDNPISSDVGIVEMVGENQAFDGSAPSTFFQLTLLGTDAKELRQDIQVNGVLALGDAFSILNEFRLTINNDSPASLTRNLGYILADSPVDYGWLQWNIGSSTGAFEVPFGNGTTDLPVAINVETAGTGNGNLSLTTYPTGADNLPYPETVTSLDVFGDIDSLKMVDRFWVVQDDGYMISPAMDLGFTYDADSDIDPRNSIDVSALEVTRWDAGNVTWDTLSSSISASTVASTGLQQFGAFTLRSGSVTNGVFETNLINTDLSVFPNPVVDRLLTVNFEALNTGDATMELYNSTGQLVYRHVGAIEKGSNSLVLNLPSLFKGVYFLKMNAEEEFGVAQILMLDSL